MLQDVEIYPAHAGINPGPVLLSVKRIYLPRTRGDKPKTLYQFTIDAASNPYARG